MKKITNKSSIQMFNMCAYFAPDKIPVDIFIQGKDVLTKPLQNDIVDNLKRNKIIRELTRYSLVSWGRNNDLLFDDKRILYMHRLLQEVVQKSFGEDISWIHYCLALIRQVVNWEECDKNSIDIFKI